MARAGTIVLSLVFPALSVLAACSDGLGSQYSSTRANQSPSTYIPVTPGAVPVTEGTQAGVQSGIQTTTGPAVLTAPIAVTPGAVPIDTTTALAPAPTYNTAQAAAPAPTPQPVTKFAKGPLNDACLSSGRDSANTALCGCVQWVADRKLSPAQQVRGAKYFKDKHQLQEVRQSDRASDEKFWTAWKEFGNEAGRQCR